jgi:antitoxin (DNA-binding transcriptional repressor) of toxin-antitoxin stability system
MIDVVNSKTMARQLPFYLKQVEGGASFIITKKGQPIAELVPARRKSKKKTASFGCAKGPGFYMASDFDEPMTLTSTRIL